MWIANATRGNEKIAHPWYIRSVVRKLLSSAQKKSFDLGIKEVQLQ
jgi:acyl dehydratase